MLGKLMKHELRATSRTMLPLLLLTLLPEVLPVQLKSCILLPFSFLSFTLDFRLL